MKSRPIVIRVDRKTGIVAIAVALVAVGVLKISSETLTMTASYPVPAGIYNQLVTTGNSGSTPADTTFNRNAGNTILVPPTNGSGSVGIGTTSPTSKLTVVGAANVSGNIVGGGTIQVGTLAADPAGANGMIYYNSVSKKLRAFQNGAWGDLGSGGGAMGLYTTNTCVASDPYGCSARLGTAGLLTNSKTTTYSDQGSCSTTSSTCHADPCSAPGNTDTVVSPETITCTATNTLQ